MKNWLKGGTVLVTGASSGIGKELCKILLEKYAVKVIGVGRDEMKMLSLVAELTETAKENFTYRLFDVGEKEGWVRLKAELEESGIMPTLIVNNAGMFPRFSRFEGDEVITKTLQVNFYSAVYAAEVFLPSMKAANKEVGILNVSSSAALCPVVGTTAYSASKCALKGFTQALSLEQGKAVYIGAVFPGTTATGLFTQNETLTKSGMIEKLATPSYKMAKKIVKVLLRRKRYAVLGLDAKLMNFVATVAPVKGTRMIRNIMKKFGAAYFNGVFDE